jgi:hypothetical protein
MSQNEAVVKACSMQNDSEATYPRHALHLSNRSLPAKSQTLICRSVEYHPSVNVKVNGKALGLRELEFDDVAFDAPPTSAKLERS